ncbi:unnamed protein product, partial [Brachionus calyciflorus]
MLFQMFFLCVCIVNSTSILDDDDVGVTNNSSSQDIIEINYDGNSFYQTNINAYKTFSQQSLILKNITKFVLSEDLFFYPFKEIIISEANFMFYLNNSFKLPCDFNYFESFRIKNMNYNSFTSSLTLDSTIKYPDRICPYIFYFTSLSTLSLFNLTESNKLDFIPVKSNKNAVIFHLIIKDSHISLDKNIISTDMFYYTNSISIKDSNLIKIESNTFIGLESLKKILVSNSYLNDTVWLQNLNHHKISEDFYDCYSFLKKYKYPIPYKFYLILNMSLNEQNYFFHNKNFCSFANFPHSKLVFPILNFKIKQNCTCNILWFILNWKLNNYIKSKDTTYYDMNTSSLNECFNKFDTRIRHCDFKKKLKECNVSLKESQYYFKCDPKRHYYQKGCIQNFIGIIFMILISLIGLFLNILSIFILRDSEFKENMYRYMKIKITFETMCLVTLFLNGIVKYSVDFYTLFFLKSCDLDFRLESQALIFIKFYIVNFITYFSITCSLLSNFLMVIDRYVQISSNQLFLSVYTTKSPYKIVLPVIVVMGGFLNLNQIFYCNVDNCVENTQNNLTRYMMFFFQDFFNFTIIIISFVINIKLVNFVRDKEKKKNNLLNNTVEKKFVKVKLLVVINCVIILVSRFPEYVLSFYKIKLIWVMQNAGYNHFEEYIDKMDSSFRTFL